MIKPSLLFQQFKKNRFPQTGSKLGRLSVALHACSLLAHDGDNEVVLDHQPVFGDEDCEAPAEGSAGLKLVEDRLVVEEGVGEDSVDAATDRAQLGHRGLLDGNPRRKVLIAVEETRSTVQRVPRVVDGRTLLGRLVRGTQEDPLLGGRHLRAGGGLALSLEPHRQAVQLHAELS